MLSGMATGFTGGALGTTLNGGSFSDIMGAGIKGAVIGDLAAITAGIGVQFGNVGTFASGKFNLLNELGRAGAHALAQGTFSAIRGGNFWQGAAAGLFSSFGGSVSGGEDISGFWGTVGVSSAMGGVGAAIGGARSAEDILFGMAAGAMVGALNFAEHEIEEKSLLDKAIQTAGFEDPNASAENWSDADIRNNIAKILPSLYNEAGSPSFQQMDVIANDQTIDGQANAMENNGRIVSKGIVYIKTSTMDHINHLVSTAGHELIHMSDYVSGRYQLWYSFGGNIAKAFTESRAYGWEISMGSTYGIQANWRVYTSIANKFKSSMFGQ